MDNLTDEEYFDISFVNTNISTLAYWDISVEFYAIGLSNLPIFTLNAYGDNLSETATLFASSLNTEFLNSQNTVTPSTYTPMHYWWTEHGVLSQSVSDVAGTHYLGLLINAQASDNTTNFTCEMAITSRSMDTFEDGAQVDIGSDNGVPFDDFDMFHVREFEFANFWHARTHQIVITLRVRIVTGE